MIIYTYTYWQGLSYTHNRKSLVSVAFEQKRDLAVLWVELNIYDWSRLKLFDDYVSTCGKDSRKPTLDVRGYRPTLHLDELILRGLAAA